MSPASHLLSTFALNAAWQVLVVVAAAAAGDALLRRASARARHGLWLSTLLLVLALPLLAMLPRGAAPGSRPAVSVPGVPEVAPSTTMPGAGAAEGRLRIPVAGVAGLAAAALVLVAAAWRGAGLVRAMRGAARWRAAAVDGGSARVEALMRECEEAYGLGPVPVRTLPGLDGPVTLGALRPVVLLPPSFPDDHGDDAIRAALGHELAHVRRRDYARNLLHEVALLPFAWHPSARVLRRRLDETREMACDELASEKVLEPRCYARSLVAVAAASRGRGLSPAFGVNDAGILEERIRHLLRPRGGSGRRRRLEAAAGVALLLITSVSASFAVVEAEPLPATAPAEWRSQMKHVVGAVVLALGLPASGDELAKGLEALKAGDLTTAAASVEKAVAANPKDRDALYTLGVIRWQEAYNGLGAAKKAGKIEGAERDRLKKTVTLGHDAIGKAIAIDPSFFEALAYDNLLYRLDAELATDPAEAGKYLAKAEENLAKAKQLKAAGGSAPAPKLGAQLPPPPPSKKAPPPPPPPAPPAAKTTSAPPPPPAD